MREFLALFSPKPLWEVDDSLPMMNREKQEQQGKKLRVVTHQIAKTPHMCRFNKITTAQGKRSESHHASLHLRQKAGMNIGNENTIDTNTPH